MSSSVIIALDFLSWAEASVLVHELGEEAASYKVGLQPLTEEGPLILARALVRFAPFCALCLRRSWT
jgi:orotidine-5'-phosphate decarboxylase